ncbi:MAG: hypothetical protein R3Y60_02920 [bacterium]
MSQVEEALALAQTYIAIVNERYGDYQFKKKAKKDWPILFNHHVTNLSYLFTREEVQLAYKNAINELGMFCQENAKFRK